MGTVQNGTIHENRNLNGTFDVAVNFYQPVFVFVVVVLARVVDFVRHRRSLNLINQKVEKPIVYIR